MPYNSTPAWAVIRGDLDVQTFLNNPAPPRCCAETQFDRKIWDELNSLVESFQPEEIVISIGAL